MKNKNNNKKYDERKLMIHYLSGQSYTPNKEKTFMILANTINQNLNQDDNYDHIWINFPASISKIKDEKMIAFDTEAIKHSLKLGYEAPNITIEGYCFGSLRANEAIYNFKDECKENNWNFAKLIHIMTFNKAMSLISIEKELKGGTDNIIFDLYRQLCNEEEYKNDKCFKSDFPVKEQVILYSKGDMLVNYEKASIISGNEDTLAEMENCKTYRCNSEELGHGDGFTLLLFYLYGSKTVTPYFYTGPKSVELELINFKNPCTKLGDYQSYSGLVSSSIT